MTIKNNFKMSLFLFALFNFYLIYLQRSKFSVEQMLLCRSPIGGLRIFQDRQSWSPSLNKDLILSHDWLVFLFFFPLCAEVLSMSTSFFPFHVPLLPPYDLLFPKQREVLTCPGPTPILTWRGPPPASPHWLSLLCHPDQSLGTRTVVTVALIIRYTLLVLIRSRPL